MTTAFRDEVAVGVEVEVAREVRDEAAALVSERLEAELCLLAAHDASLMYRRLVMLAEFDRRELAGSWGMVSTAAWLAWRTSLDPRTAREQVRVARALSMLPITAEAMARGDLTYSKVRALTRFVTPAVESKMVELAMHTTAAQLELVAGWVARQSSLDGVGGAKAAPPVLRTWFDDDGMGVLQVRLPPEDLALVLRAVDALVESLRENGGHGAAEGDDGGADANEDDPVARDVGDVAAGAGDAPDSSSGGGGSAEPRGSTMAVSEDAVASADAFVDGDEAFDDDDWYEASAPPPGEPVLIDGWFVYPDDDDGDDDWGGSAEPCGATSSTAGEPDGAAVEQVRDLGQRRAEAFPLLAAAVLGGGAEGFTGDRYLINVFTDASVLEGGVRGDDQLNLLDDGSVISSAVVERLACSEPMVLIMNDKDGNPLFMGRKVRLANRRQRRAALARSNGMCAFPACTRKVWIQVHHCDPWGKGGATDIVLLVPLCWHHHHCVHEGGFRVEPVPGGFAFYTPDGRRIEEVPSITAGLTLAEIREHLARPLRDKPLSPAPWAGSGERMDLDCTLSAVFSALTRADEVGAA